MGLVIIFGVVFFGWSVELLMWTDGMVGPAEGHEDVQGLKPKDRERGNKERNSETVVVILLACSEGWITLKSIHAIAQGIPLAGLYQVSFPHECRRLLSSSQGPKILSYHCDSPSFLASAAHPSLPVCTAAPPAAQSAPSASQVELG